jgi:hypothetical protein
MKTILVPAPVTLVDRITRETGRTYSFHDWACMAWFNDVRWHQGENLARLVKIVNLFDQAVVGKPLLFEDADYAILAQIVQAPQIPQQLQQPPLVCIQFEAHKTAVLRAKEAP